MELFDASCKVAIEASLNSALLKTILSKTILLKTILLLLLALCLASSASAKYSLEKAETNIIVNASGITHVEELVSYAFDGDHIDIHRELKVLPGDSIRNVKGRCSEKACKLRFESIPEGYRLIGKLPDPTPEKLTLFISYDYYGAVKFHRDVSEFSYRLWGGEWEKPLKSFKGNVILPVKSESKIQYWTHPVAYTQEANIENNVISLRTGEISSTQWYEVRAVFPRIASSGFSPVKVDDTGGLENVLATEYVYQQKNLILNSLYRKTFLFALLVLIFPLIIYYIYGREQKIDYEIIAETEVPDNSKPAVVNAIVMGKMGIPTIDGFTATVMDLVNRGYISLRNLKPEELVSLYTPESDSSNTSESDSSHNPESDPFQKPELNSSHNPGSDSSQIPESGSKDFMVELLNNEIYSEAEGSLSELEDFEKDVLYLLKIHAPERKISWKKLEKELQSGKSFYQFLTSWNKKVQAYTAFDDYFQFTGNIYMYWFARTILMASIVYYILISGFFPTKAFPLASKINVMTSLIGIFGFVIIRCSGMFIKIFGHWTPEGSLYYKQCDNFKKYLTDLSALKEHSPESIETWDSYLVYAISLGISKELLQNMSLIVPSEQLRESRFYPISSSYIISERSCENASSSSCFGDINRE
ncbi:hypothetical protein A9239_17535 [Methanosarcina sp. A14]|uniref:DUF2207 domain-containing protein n=2 Tax=Methanosarcina barkeri TaxID=2208 RepID=A0A0E3QVB2_METBA|nr:MULTISPECIES: DUF2207 domain-containing protein [Methanosarcina]AKB54688.1 hypothetical protein MSBRM_1690 [Methanosarcina barkeri MS]AKJ37790.1 hypothetical protein MCM1_0706 [Methanosarcina barkeri CM1]OEC92066.1 hypothetical protein A9239_17535 [Methanosarcina sp. A14]